MRELIKGIVLRALGPMVLGLSFGAAMFWIGEKVEAANSQHLARVQHIMRINISTVCLRSQLIGNGASTIR
jgi:hypothetical protein